MPSVKVMVEGGKATAAAPLGPALGPLGINIGEVVSQINSKTKDFQGMKVPVKITVDTVTKKFEVEVGFPPMSALIKKEAGVAKASKDPKREFVGNISVDQAIVIAKKKESSLYSYNLKSNVKEVLGTCDSMGITVEGKRARHAIKAIDEGKFDSNFDGTSAPKEKPAQAPVEEKAEEKPAEEKAEVKPAKEPKAEQAVEEKPEEKKEEAEKPAEVPVETVSVETAEKPQSEKQE